MRTQAGKFTLSGDGLCVGYDSADTVSHRYQAPAKLSGGKVQFVGVTVEKAECVDLERDAQRVLMHD